MNNFEKFTEVFNLLAHDAEKNVANALFEGLEDKVISELHGFDSNQIESLRTKFLEAGVILGAEAQAILKKEQDDKDLANRIANGEVEADGSEVSKSETSQPQTTGQIPAEEVVAPADTETVTPADNQTGVGQAPADETKTDEVVSNDTTEAPADEVENTSNDNAQVAETEANQEAQA